MLSAEDLVEVERLIAAKSIGGVDSQQGLEQVVKRVMDRDPRVQVPGAVAAYVPVWTGSGGNPAIGNGTLTGRWSRIGKLVFVSVDVVAGSTTTFGAGTYGLSLPVAAVAGQRWMVGADVLDVGVQHYVGQAIVNGGAAFEEIMVGSNATGPGAWSATFPFTFGNTDRAVISGVYEAA